MANREQDEKMTAKDVTILRSRETKQIILPQNMPLREAMKWLKRKDDEEDKNVAVHYELDCFPLDGAVAFRDALDSIYGFVAASDTPTWFGPQPPVMIGVPISSTKTRQVPWGRVQIPGVEGYLNTSLNANPYPRFIINGEVKQRHLIEVQEVVNKTKELLQTQSIYKGKAVKLDLSWLRQGGKFDPTGHAPKFCIPTEEVIESDLIFPDAVEDDIRIGLFTPIEHSQQCRQHGVPLKRGILLAGPYGTGKTLTAYVTAKKAVRQGWTFIYLTNVLDLARGFQFAAQYAPAVIFAEDVDRAVSGERSEEMDAILNSFDGVDTKHGEVITVLTTNHLENLNQAILRPGRCDTLVEVTKPDAVAAAKLVKLYGRGLLNEKADLKKIGQALGGHIPAEIREAVERAKLAAIDRLGQEGRLNTTDGIYGEVMEQDVLAAVHAMKAQHDLLEPRDKDQRSPVEKCAEIIGTHIGNSVANRDRDTLMGIVQALGNSPQQIIDSVERNEKSPAVAAAIADDDE